MKLNIISSLTTIILILLSCINKNENRSVEMFYDANNTTVFTQVPSKELFIIKTKHIVTQLYDSLLLNAESSIKTIPFASNVSYILPDFKGGLIGDIDKLEFFNNFLYILDKKANSIWIYNINGQLLKKIHNEGRGPGEYLKIFDFSIDSKNERIVVGVSGKMQYYDLEGDFIKEYKQDNYYIAIACGNTGTLYCFSTKAQNVGYSMGKWSIFSQVNDTVKTIGFPFLPFDYADVLPAFNELLIKNYKNEVLTRQTWADSIYRINSDSTYQLHAYLQIEPSESRYKKILTSKGSTYEQAVKFSESNYKMGSFLETSNCIFGSYAVPFKGRCNFLIDKYRGAQYNINNLPTGCGFEDSEGRSFLTSLLHTPMFISDDDRFVGYYWPWELEEWNDAIKNGLIIENKALIKYFEEFDINGNPLIVLYKVNFRSEENILQ